MKKGEMGLIFSFELTCGWERFFLCEKFGRLIDLAENKSSTVVEIFSLGWKAGVGRGCGGESCGRGKKRDIGRVLLNIHRQLFTFTFVASFCFIHLISRFNKTMNTNEYLLIYYYY
jgi:hypothetical protein